MMQLRDRLLMIVNAPIVPSYCATARDAIAEIDRLKAELARTYAEVSSVVGERLDRLDG